MAQSTLSTRNRSFDQMNKNYRDVSLSSLPSSSSANMGFIKRHRHPHLHLFEEIIEEIIIRLPVKSINIFKCVSKSWFALITSSRFIYKHLITSNETFLARAIFVCFEPEQIGRSPSHECVIRTMNICDIQMPAIDNGPVLNFNLPTPPPDSIGRLEFVDHCNGIVCFKFLDFILLVNPSLKQVKNLPSPPICEHPDYCTLLFVGFDSLNKDFKVVRILHLETWEGVVQQIFEIYTLRSNSWRKVDESPSVFVDYIDQCRRTIFLNGVIHWCVGSIRCEWRMLMFNVSTELFEHIEFPQGWDKRVNLSFGEAAEIVPDLFVLNQDTLAFALYARHVTTYVDIWIMNKDNKDETWTKLYVFGPLTQFRKPLNFSKKNTFLYQAFTGKLILYDVVNNHACVSRLPDTPGAVIELGEFRASLVSLNM